MLYTVTTKDGNKKTYELSETFDTPVRFADNRMILRLKDESEVNIPFNEIDKNGTSLCES